jgi:hypothetical protein
VKQYLRAILLIGWAILVCNPLAAQGGWKIVNFTQQNWSGGIAGSYGSYFTITLAVNKTSLAKRLLKVRILGHWYDIPKLSDSLAGNAVQLRKMNSNGQYIYTIIVNARKEQLIYPGSDFNGAILKEQASKPPASDYPYYDCIMIDNNNRRKSVFIKLPSRKILPSLSYP